MDLASQDIKFLPGVGPRKADLFDKELSIKSAEDLLRHYLYEITADMPFIQVKGQILRFEKVGEGHSLRLTAIFTDGKETIELVWFKGVKFVVDKYRTETEYVVFGK